MQTEPNAPDARLFDAEAARDASLTATLSRVRLCRRVRRAGNVSVALLTMAAVVWLAMPAPVTNPGRHVAENPLIVRSSPLAAEQKVVSIAMPGLFVRTPTAPLAAIRFTTPVDAPVARLGEEEFHRWLAANNLCCIQLGTDTLKVLPLHTR